MVLADILQLQRGAAELQGSATVAYRLIGQRRVGVGKRREPRLDVLVRQDGGAGVLEGFAAGDVVVVVMAVDQILDRLVGDFLDLVDVLLAAVRPAMRHGVGRDHTRLGDDEDRLMVAVAEQIDVVGAVDLLGLDLRPLCLLSLRRHGERRGQQRGADGCKQHS